MKGLIVFILLLWGMATLQAQDKPAIIRVEAQVLSAVDSLPVPYVHVWGKKGNTGTVTDTAGWFSLYAFTDDSLIFSDVNHGKQAQAIPPTAAHNHVVFWLAENSYDIDEVVILPFSKEQFKNELMALKLPPDKYAINLNLPKPPPMPDNTLQLSKPATIILSILAMTVTLDIYSILPEKVAFKERWEQKQVDKWLTREQYLDGLSRKYSPQVVQTIVPVPDEQIEAFMKFCDVQPEFVEAASDYHIAVAIKDCYLAWVELPKAGE